MERTTNVILTLYNFVTDLLEYNIKPPQYLTYQKVSLPPLRFWSHNRIESFVPFHTIISATSVEENIFDKSTSLLET